MGPDTQTYVGNGKKVEVPTNSGVLRIIGNNCYVTVAKNEGQILFTGNKGHLQVNQNIGNIAYTGNNGLIEVGKTCKGIGQVVYTGNGGVVRRMKSKPEAEKCSATKTSTKNPPPPPQEQKPEELKKEVQSELRVNGVEVRMNRKSMKSGVSKESSGHQKVKRTSTAPASCCKQARNVVWPTANLKTEGKVTRINMSSGISNIELVNVNNFELENWCLNMGTELLAL
ncbi:hypothetical protein C0J52_00547 [Blattella germanica]|nr:hypothetical protein C0J52_00547 [Blattella germanica]